MQQSLVELAMQMHRSVDMTDEHDVKKFLGFTPVGENLVGIRRRPLKLMQEDSLEIGPRGIVRPPRAPLGLYVIFGGTPHHTQHLFGYWHINDVDELYITAGSGSPEEDATRILLMRYPRPGERDMFAWYCQQCVTLLYCFVYQTGRDGFEGFWRAEREAVKLFNGDPKLRICPNCSWQHPLGYGFMSHKDTPEEAAARAGW